METNYSVPIFNIKISLLSYSHPQESRFKAFFDQIKPKKKRKAKNMSVNVKNVSLDIDKRTSIIIKNIPKDISNNKFYEIILKLCPNIDYFYIPVNIKSRKKLRVAFVNVKNYKLIIPIYMGLLYKMKFNYNSPDINMEICYSKYQGRDRLIQRFLCDKPFINKNNHKKNIQP